MKQVLGCLRRADNDWNLINDGDNIAVGVSGGKDSMLLLHSLALYRLFSKKNYGLEALTLDMGFEDNKPDLSAITAYCEKLGVRHTIVPTSIGEIVFNMRKEKNPCSLCANLRRGIMNNAALSLGCKKIALGHNMDDVLETMLMSLLYEGRFHTFFPKTLLDRSGVTVIRPFVYLNEKHIINVGQKLNLPVVKSPCPAAGHTTRQRMKEMLSGLCAKYPDAKKKMLHALQSEKDLWDK